ncbi:MAG: hypothetical protein PWQ79_2279 [Thermococcaceae archaeon]|jgi:hypothetical protein|uniref:hypothetical protein n=1 Tax=unclassified Thermococcus TaxID=2627626 RepID=UPI0005B2AD09|nr:MULTISPECIES: hypothetical protein [unclassified Thermococcus]MDK2915364.1 hypothetical protein [Thermococcaceae archaeon]
MNLITWYFDVEYLRKNLEIEEITTQGKTPMQLSTILKLFRLPAGRYSLKILGKEVLADDSGEAIYFPSVPQDAFLVSIYLRGALEKFNQEIATKTWFVEFLRKYVYPPEIRRIPDPRLREVPIEELRREYLLECPDVKGYVFDVTFGKILSPVVFKLKGEKVFICSELYFADKGNILNPKRVVIEGDAGSLSRAFLKMGEETLKSLVELGELLPPGAWKEPLAEYIEVLNTFRKFSLSLVRGKRT